MMWGYAIPGLAMTAGEIPDVVGLMRANNPGVDGAPRLDSDYSLEDLAEHHLKIINTSFQNTDPLVIIGMSMGGMIAQILASKFRNLLPANTSFRLIATSLNSPDLPCIPKQTLSQWKSGVFGKEDTFRPFIEPFFSPSFVRKNSQTVIDYISFRAHAKNNQSPKEFMKQVSAILRFNGAAFVPTINQSELHFIHGEDDTIMGKAHQNQLQSVFHSSRHQTQSKVGHMFNIEAPGFFERSISQ